MLPVADSKENRGKIFPEGVVGQNVYEEISGIVDRHECRGDKVENILMISADVLLVKVKRSIHQPINSLQSGRKNIQWNLESALDICKCRILINILYYFSESQMA